MALHYCLRAIASVFLIYRAAWSMLVGREAQLLKGDGIPGFVYSSWAQGILQMQGSSEAVRLLRCEHRTFPQESERAAQRGYRHGVKGADFTRLPFFQRSRWATIRNWRAHLRGGTLGLLEKFLEKFEALWRHMYYPIEKKLGKP